MFWFKEHVVMFIVMQWNGFSLQRNKSHMLVLLSAEFGTIFYLYIKNI